MTITPMHAPDFYVDTFAAVTMAASYVAYRVTNNIGFDRGPIWMRLTGFRSILQLGGGQPDTQKVLIGTGSNVVYFYLTASYPTAAEQSYDIQLWLQDPARSSSRPL